MSEFSFLFSLYSLLLSFSLVELLSGLGRTIEERLSPHAEGEAQLHVGLLTPLLGVFVLLDLLSFWSAAWVVRDMLQLSSLALMGILLFASSYYLAAFLVFPSNPSQHTDLDDHYFRVRRIVMGVLLVLLVWQLGFYSTQAALAPLLWTPRSLVLTVVLVVLMLLAMVVRSRRLNEVVLTLLVLRYLVVYFL